MALREIRLNNPGGIKKTSQHWFGSSNVQDDPVFIRFDTPVYGVRALMKVLLNYQSVHGLNTIRGIIERWAPETENDTEAYINDVAQRMGMGPDGLLDLKDIPTLIKLTQCIIHHECGTCPDPTLPFWYDDETFNEAVKLALGISP